MDYLVSPPVRNHVTSIPYDEHVTNISLGESCGQHPRVDTSDEYCCGDRIVPDLLELLHHVPLLLHPVLHDAVQHLVDPHSSLHNHLENFTFFVLIGSEILE